MKFRHFSKILSILLVIIVCGCVSQRKEPPWVDLSEIHDQLIQDKKQQAVIDEVKQGDVNKVPQGPTVKNMSAGQDLTNPALQSFAKKKTAERGGASAEGEGVLLNFDNADIYEVIQVIAEILNLDYIVDPRS